MLFQRPSALFSDDSSPAASGSFSSAATRAHAAAAGTSLHPPSPAVPLDIPAALMQGSVKPVNIAMLVVGTRGDVQPIIGIALKLKEYGHRVRIATHKVFREFVTGFGIEFFPLGGDPKVLIEFMVKHRGFLPGLNFVDAARLLQQTHNILYSSYDACTLPDPEHPDATFVADAMVANPVVYGATHVAEKLNIPLHIVFTMPWTPTKLFPCPMAGMNTDLDASVHSRLRSAANWLSYFVVNVMMWLAIAPMVRSFRKQVLSLPSFDRHLNGAHGLRNSEVPVSYTWSPALVERPNDWPDHCRVTGFVHVPLKSLTEFQPPQEWKDFLEAGPAPVYIGFGSLVVGDAERLTQRFLKALKASGLRAVIQAGWGGLRPTTISGAAVSAGALSSGVACLGSGLGRRVSCISSDPSTHPAEGAGLAAAGLSRVVQASSSGHSAGQPTPTSSSTTAAGCVSSGRRDGGTAGGGQVLFIGQAPHDWLFPRCAALIHHGGAGTTATGLYYGKPTFIVPFFGDQGFWGAACHKAGVGPAPIPIDKLTTRQILQALRVLVKPECKAAALAMQQRLVAEDGTSATVQHLHQTIYGALLEGVVYKWMKGGARHGAPSWRKDLCQGLAPSSQGPHSHGWTSPGSRGPSAGSTSPGLSPGSFRGDAVVAEGEREQGVLGSGSGLGLGLED